MELAVSTLFMRAQSFEDVLRELPRLGTRHVELIDSGPHTLTPERVARLRELRASYGLDYSVHAPWADTNLSADDDSIRGRIVKRLQESIRWASQLEAHALVFHPGWKTFVESSSPGRGWRLNLESVRMVLGCAEEHGVEALIENVPGPTPFYLKTVRDFTRFFGELGVEAGMTLDIGHSNLIGETELFLERFGPRIRHIHAHDNLGDADNHLPIGGGSVRWEETMAAIRRAGFDDWIVIESIDDVGGSLERLMGLL
jgi:sugar phosphate isomerase/epimerase